MNRLVSLSGVVAAVTGVLLAAPAAAAAAPQTDPTPAAATASATAVTAGVAGSSGVRPQLNMALDFARDIASARTARVGHDRALVQRRQLVPAVRRYVTVSGLRARRFTISAVGDQACVTWTGPGRSRVRRGACSPADRVVVRTPLTDSASALGGLVDHLLAAEPSAVRSVFHVHFLRAVANLVAPAQVRVTGVLDRDRDRVDDDGRVTFRSNGRAVCAQLPMRKADRPRVFYTACANLRPRRAPGTDRLRYRLFEVEQVAGAVAAAVTDAAAGAGVPVAALPSTLVGRVARPVLPAGARVRVLEPGTILVAGVDRCRAVLVFGPRRGAAPAVHVSCGKAVRD